MSADWTTCRVVRDREDLLWTNAYDENLADSGGWWASVIGSHTGEALESWRGPLTPVLDADGQPVVTTVGDLTARHIGRQVRTGSGMSVPLDWAWFLTLTSGDLDTPCEVIE